jgi:hypothetical protein
MTRTRYRIHEKEYPYFLTCTIVGWQAVFTRPEAVEIVFDSWQFLKQERGFRLHGYVGYPLDIPLAGAGAHVLDHYDQHQPQPFGGPADVLVGGEGDTIRLGSAGRDYLQGGV